jgi:hypothetical protein
MKDDFQIFAYPAGCADAFRIRFLGVDKKYHNIFIDSGLPRAYKEFLGKEIKSIEESDERIDAWLISHIDDDHIGGVKTYISQIQKGKENDIVDRWIYNAPRLYPELTTTSKSKEPSQGIGIKSGDAVWKYIQSVNKINSLEEFSATTSPINLLGLKMTFLSPSKTDIEKLRNKHTPKTGEPSKPKSPRTKDYYIKVEDFDFSDWKTDHSEANRSSIVCLTEYENSKTLWLADSHSEQVIESLRELGYSDENPICCDLVKVSHHGSFPNNSPELYKMIDCQNYLISADGKGNPAKKTLAMILRNQNRDLSNKYFFHFTNEAKELKNIFDSDGSEVFEKWNFEVKFVENNLLKY